MYYDADALPQLAGLFYRQSVEERNHAMIMVQYLLDADEKVVIPGVEAPQTEFRASRSRSRWRSTRRSASRISAPTSCGVARENGDFAGEQFMQWFIKEQIEEVAKMSTLLRVVERAGDDALRVEEFLAREGDGGDGGSDPGMPAAAGGASVASVQVARASASAPGAVDRSPSRSGGARTARAAASRATSTRSRPRARSCSTTRAGAARAPWDRAVPRLLGYARRIHETGESLEDCVRRELREEAGVEIEVGRLVLPSPTSTGTPARPR